jgi:hypothetical protein
MSATDLGDPDRTIHIAARDLTGSREAKLAELDALLAQLQVVRLALCGRPVPLEELMDVAGRRTPPHGVHRWSRVASRLASPIRAVTRKMVHGKRERP